jgi:hypothetical protein
MCLAHGAGGKLMAFHQFDNNLCKRQPCSWLLSASAGVDRGWLLGWSRTSCVSIVMGTRVQALDWPLAGTGERAATVRELQSLIIATRVGKLQGTLALGAAAPCSQ